MYQIDLDILYFLNHTISSAALDAAMSIVTNVRYWIPVYVLGTAYLIWRHKWYGARIVFGVAALAAIADYGTNQFIKGSIGRERPCVTDSVGAHAVSWIRLPDGGRGGFGMPSSHAVNNFAAAAFFALIFRSRRIAISLFAIATVIALTRPYLGLHYPSDILAGAIGGGLLGFIFAIGFLRAEKKFFGKPKSDL